MTWSETVVLWAVPVVFIGGTLAFVIYLACRKKWIATLGTTVGAFLLFAIAAPSYVPARYAAWRNTCINNMVMISEAKRSWAAADGKSTNDAPTGTDLVIFLRHGEIPTCPADGRAYSIGRVGETPSCPNEKTRGHDLP
jgi:hypothetical protein